MSRTKIGSVKKGVLSIICMVLVQVSLAQHTNELIHESSPYLQQHAHNPVNWYPWGEKALNKAKEENKMLLISVGYSACHWCHVMEQESFEDAEVAKLMNEHFVCIKVDREERPDVDKVYLTAAQMTSGNAGWPLNAFALPDGRPFYGASYFEKAQWTRLLNYFVKLYADEPEKIRDQAMNLSKGISTFLGVEKDLNTTEIDRDGLVAQAEKIMGMTDPVRGGLNGSPKFPIPGLWEYLLHFGHAEADQLVTDQVMLTLNELALSGTYDQVGGGFFRYSTDDGWKIPHFEKMLYDNAQLVLLYTHAWQKSKNPLYKKVVYQTLEFIEREMTSQDGGFYSSMDADSEGEEGKYYHWKGEELMALLGSDADLFMAYAQCTPDNRMENGAYHLRFSGVLSELASVRGLTESDAATRIERCQKILLEARSKRSAPGIDRKQLTAWNAMMLKAELAAYRVFGEQKFMDAALRNAEFLRKFAIAEKGIMRSTMDGKSSIPAFLDDHAAVIDAWIELYQTTMDERWLLEAKHWQERTLEVFYDQDAGMFRYSPVQELFSENFEVDDNVIPSSNSMCAHNLLRLGHYFYDTSYQSKALHMYRIIQSRLMENPARYANWARLALLLYDEPYECAILGPEAPQLLRELDQNYLPGMLLYISQGKSDLELMEGKFIAGQTTIYVCQNRSCKMPVNRVEDALPLLQK